MRCNLLQVEKLQSGAQHVQWNERAVTVQRGALDAVLNEVHGGADDVHQRRRLYQDPHALVLHQLVPLALLVCATRMSFEARMLDYISMMLPCTGPHGQLLSLLPCCAVTTTSSSGNHIASIGG